MAPPPLPPGFVLEGQGGPAPGAPVTLGSPRPASPPSGYRPNGGGLEPIPGGPADPTRTPPAPPSGYRFRPDGSLEPIPGGPAADGQGGEATEGERRAAAFLRNALAAARDYESSGVAPPASGTDLGTGILGPRVMGALPEPVGYSPEREQAVQRELAFTNAVLRAESGANAPEPETARYVRQYFPGAGASPEVQETFRAARRRAVQSLLGMGGRAVDPQLRQEVEAWLTGDPAAGATPPASAAPALGGQPPQEAPTAAERPIMPSGPAQMELSDQVQSGTNPALAGLNQRIGQMVQQDRPVGEMVRYLRERGVSGPSLTAIAQELARIRRWRRENNYRGPHDVDLERYERELDPITSTLASAADTGPGAAAGSYIDTMTGGHLDNIAGAFGGDSELTNLAMQQVRERHPGASLAGDVVAGGSLYGAGRAALTRILGRSLPTAVGTVAPRAIAGDAALGGYIGSGQGGTDLVSPEGTIAGVIGGAAGGAAGRGLINTGASLISPTGGALAPVLREGGRPTIGQRMGGVADRAEQAFASIPLIGGVQRAGRNRAIEEFQGGAFNQALREIGQELPRGVTHGRAAHKFTQRAFRNEFDGARRQMSFTPDGQFANDFGAIARDVDSLPTDVKAQFERILRNELGGRLRGGRGSLTGDAYQRAVTRLEDRARATRRRQDGQELAEALDSVVEALDDAAGRQSPAAAVEQLTRARAGYARLVVIEDAARRRGGAPGEFSPTQLDAAVQNVSGGIRSRRYLAGDALMQDYAQSGLRLGSTVPDSGTPERLMTGLGTMGALGGAAHFLNPYTLAPWAIDTAANLPGARQTLGALMTPRPALDPLAEAVRRRAYLGSAGVPLAIEGGQ